MSTNPRPTTDRTATDRTPRLTDGKWRAEGETEPTRSAQLQFSPCRERRLHNLVDAANAAMLEARTGGPAAD
jgi:hypothetical protein